MKTKYERAAELHANLVKDLAKASDARESASRVYIRKTARYDQAVKAVARSSKRLDKLRAEERNAKRAKKDAREPVAVEITV